jgi:hypothetical protein
LERGTELDKTEQTELIKLAIEGVNFLRTLHFGNAEFPAWRNRVMQLLKQAYGENSPEYRRFINAPGKAFIVRTETGQAEEYFRKLDCYESVLKSLAGMEE